MTSNDNINMFYAAKPHIFEKAKALRKNMTQAEKILWRHLKGKQMLNLKFRAQHPLDIFIADFYCHVIKMVIEVDGDYHNEDDQKVYDIGRDDEIINWGITIIRFTNNEIINDINKVLDKIENTCKGLISGLPLLTEEERPPNP